MRISRQRIRFILEKVAKNYTNIDDATNQIVGEIGKAKHNDKMLTSKPIANNLSGKIKWFNSKKGYGFIVNESDSDVFVHYSDINLSGYRTLKEGQYVQYDMYETKNGLHATNVVLISEENINE